MKITLLVKFYDLKTYVYLTLHHFKFFRKSTIQNDRFNRVVLDCFFCIHFFRLKKLAVSEKQ